MKIASINNYTAKPNNNNNNHQSFKGTGLMDSMVNFWQFIDNGGRALQFTAEDMAGTNIPRSIKGLVAGKKYTGHINLPAFFQEAIREFLTGPTMCITPWIILSLAKKSGKTANTHVENIKNLSHLLENTPIGQEAKDIEGTFYTTVVKDMFKQSSGKDASQESVSKMVELFKELGNQKDKKECKRVLSEIQKLYEQVIKSTKDNYSKTDFTGVKYTVNSAGKQGATKFKNYAEYATTYIKDFTKKFGSDVTKENINNFKSTWIGKRLTIVAGMLVITGILMSQIPKLYTKASGKINPNAKAIYDEAKKDKTSNQTKTVNSKNASDVNNTKNETNAKSSKALKIGGGIALGTAAAAALIASIYKGKQKPQVFDAVLSKFKNAAEYTSGKFDNLSKKLGLAAEDNKTLEKVLKFIEPTGANNSFLGLAGLMGINVILPRVRTAKKRNPGNKEATKDEIREILFRDVQTVLIILFALKSMNTIIARGATKIGGLPMTNRSYLPVFGKSSGDILQRLKNAGKNILDTIHPTKGVYALTNDEFVAKYSNYSFEDLPKILSLVEEEKGDKTKVFNKIIDSVIKKYETILEGDSKTATSLKDLISSSKTKDGKEIEDLAKVRENIKATIEALKKIKEQGADSIDKIDNEAVKSAISDFLKNQNNGLVQSAKRLNAGLRTGALAIESGYLGWGLPAINQVYLEKKYLKNNKQNNCDPCSAKSKDNGTLIGKNIKAHQIKLYHKFIK